MKIKLSNEKIPRGRKMVNNEFIKTIIVNNKYIGSIVFLEENNQFANLLKITIEKEYRNKGIGTFIINQLINTYKEFRVLDINPTAINFWKKWNVKIKRDSEYRFYTTIKKN
tara:strand:+ start:1127 stop:1462 length:336 start_codon:yes stop_codon:yes gene_type:complete